MIRVTSLLHPHRLAVLLSLAISVAAHEGDTPELLFGGAPSHAFWELNVTLLEQNLTQSSGLGFAIPLALEYRGALELRYTPAGYFSTIPKQAQAADLNYSGTHHILDGDELWVALKATFASGHFRLMAGEFPVNLNPDAALQAEYLLRHNAYPTMLFVHETVFDDWGALRARVEGAHLGYQSPRRRFRADAVLLSGWGEEARPNDHGLAFHAAGGLSPGVEAGVGILFDGLRLAPQIGAAPVVDDSGHYVQDSLGNVQLDTVRFTRQSTSFTARLSVDPKAWFSLPAANGWEWRVFAEAAVMGWENQPIFYKNRLDRVVWTAGIHLPAFGWLDRACLQWERRTFIDVDSYWASPIWTPVPTGSGIRKSVEGFPFLFLSRTFFGFMDVQGRYSERLEDRFTAIFQPARTIENLRVSILQVRLQARF